MQYKEDILKSIQCKSTCWAFTLQCTGWKKWNRVNERGVKYTHTHTHTSWRYPAAVFLPKQYGSQYSLNCIVYWPCEHLKMRIGTAIRRRRTRATHELLLLLNVNYVQGVFKHRKYIRAMRYVFSFNFILCHKLTQMWTPALSLLFASCALCQAILPLKRLISTLSSLKPVNFVGFLWRSKW